MSEAMEYEELVDESDLANDIKIEPDEIILYGCHVCNGLAFEDYDDLAKHLEKHLESDDIVDMKQVNIGREENLS